MTWVRVVETAEEADITVAVQKSVGGLPDAKVARLRPDDPHARLDASRQELQWLEEAPNHHPFRNPLRVRYVDDTAPHDLLVQFTDTKSHGKWFNEQHPLRGRLLEADAHDPEQVGETSLTPTDPSASTEEQPK